MKSLRPTVLTDAPENPAEAGPPGESGDRRAQPGAGGGGAGHTPLDTQLPRRSTATDLGTTRANPHSPPFTTSVQLASFTFDCEII